MFCPKCGNELKDGTKFCSKCGSNVSEDNNANKASVASASKNPEADKGKKTTKILIIVLVSLIAIAAALVVVLLFVNPFEQSSQKQDNKEMVEGKEAQNRPSFPSTYNGKKVYTGTIYAGESLEVARRAGIKSFPSSSLGTEYAAILKLDTPITESVTSADGHESSERSFDVILLTYDYDNASKVNKWLKYDGQYVGIAASGFQQNGNGLQVGAGIQPKNMEMVKSN